MAFVSLRQSFDTRILTLTSGSPVVSAFGSGNSVIVGLANGFEVEFTGTDLTLDGAQPLSGTVTAITAYFVQDGISTLAAQMTASSGQAWVFSPQGLATAFDGENNSITGSSGFDRIVGGNAADLVDPRGGSDEVSLGAGNDVVYLGPAGTGALPDGLIYDGGEGTDVLGSVALAIGTLDLRAATLISVEIIELSSASAIFNSSQLDSATGLANVTSISGNLLSEVRVIQNTRVADMGNLPGATHPTWTLIGRNVADVQRGSDNLTLTLQGRGGNDTIRGRDARETLEGGSGSDLLFGGAGSDVLIGGTGADRLIGGSGNDAMTGGAGRDTFVFAPGEGIDTISGFQAFGPASDRIDLRAVTGITGFGDLIRNHLVVDGLDLLLQLGGGNSVLLTATQRADLDAGDFLFAT